MIRRFLIWSGIPIKKKLIVLVIIYSTWQINRVWTFDGGFWRRLKKTLTIPGEVGISTSSTNNRWTWLWLVDEKDSENNQPYNCTDYLILHERGDRPLAAPRAACSTPLFPLIGSCRAYITCMNYWCVPLYYFILLYYYSPYYYYYYTILICYTYYIQNIEYAG